MRRGAIPVAVFVGVAYVVSILAAINDGDWHGAKCLCILGLGTVLYLMMLHLIRRR